MTATLEKPKAAPSENPQALFGSIFGPNLPAGTYKVKVIKGKDEYLTTFTLKYPDNSPYTAEDRKVQQDVTMKLYEQSEELAYIYAAQEGMVSQAKAVVLKNPKFGKIVTPFIKELEEHNSALVFRGGDFYINTEEKLAEQISELYGQVSSYPGRPGNAQIDRAVTLDDELRKASLKFEQLRTEKLKKVNSTITSDKIFQPIRALTVDEFRKGESGGGINPKNPMGSAWQIMRIH